MNKAQNLIDHKDEIYSRAPRTWIQSNQQRKETKGRALISYTYARVLLNVILPFYFPLIYTTLTSKNLL